MSRSGYCNDIDRWDHIKWRGQVASAIRGKRGQHFLRDLIAALDAMPDKRLITSTLGNRDGDVCALGSVMHARGIPFKPSDDEYDFDSEWVAKQLNIADQLVREIVYENDECAWSREAPENRWVRMRRWAQEHLITEAQP